jgi:membrane protein implicated in regulation of membrane protease activity
MYNWLLVIIGLLFILAELVVGVATGFDLVLLGSTLVIGGVVGNFFANWQIGFGVAAILSVLYVILGRKYIKSRLSVPTQKTNTDVLVGDSAVVVKKINSSNPGQVRVGTEIWRAVSTRTINYGEKVEILGVNGVTLEVK